LTETGTTDTGNAIARLQKGLHAGPSRSRQRAAVAVFVLAGFLFDAPIRSGVLAGDGIERAGDVLQLVLPAAGVGLALGHRDFTGVVQLGTSTVLTLGVTYTLKYAVNAKRPNGGRHSFPSGHTSVSFCSSEFIRRRYGWIFGIPVYAIAGLVGYSRIEAGRHYARDVIAGAAIGIVSSRFLVRPYRGWRVRAEAGEGCWGIRLDRSW